MNNTNPQRANRLGSPCPPWCTADHAEITVHLGDPVTPGRLPWDVRVQLVQNGHDDRAPEVSVMKIAAQLLVGARDAENFAELLEALAGEPPERLRELAAEVRTAAAAIGGDAR